jgi:catalase
LAEDPAALSQRYRLPSLSDKGALVRLAAIGASVLAIALCFAYVGGWLSPGRLGEARFVDRFEEVNGVHPGFRRNHAKGVCIAGNFDSNGQGVRLSKAVVLTPGRVPVSGRFSLAGGHPHVADGPAAVLAMALRLQPPAGQEWRMAMIDIPVFLVKDGEGLYEQLLASQPDPKTGQPDPAKMAAFTAAHPEFLPAMQIVKSTPLPSGFSNATFNGLNAFRFVNASGAATAVRWSMVASEPFTPETPEQSKNPDKNYLFDDLIARVRRGPLQWHLLVTMAQPGDPTSDPTLPWPRDRERVDVGTLTIDQVETEAPGNCRDINFDPLVLPAGIEPSDDPILSARSATYSQSFTRREGEKKTPSAVQVPVGKGS